MSTETKKDHSKDNVYEALGIKEDFTKWMGEALGQIIEQEDTVSETICRLQQELKNNELGTTEKVTEYETKVFVAGMIFGVAHTRQQMGAKELSKLLDLLNKLKSDIL